MFRSVMIAVSALLAVLLVSGCSDSKISLEDVDVDLANGEIIYDDYCVLCHEGAIEGAHSLVQKDRWRESADKGFDQLVDNTVHGYRGKYGELPVMGFCPECSEKDIEDAVAFMLVASGVMQ